MNKKQRMEIWGKSNGLCWYCGCRLVTNGWHVDHLEPVYRDDNGMGKPQNDHINNMVPACAPCNLFKGVFSVEEFRREIQQQANRARMRSVNFRTAERFAQIAVTFSPIIFWYERDKHAAQTSDNASIR